MLNFSQIHALTAEISIRGFYNLLALVVFHAFQANFKGTGGGKFVFSTKATYLYGNYSPAPVNNFGETVPLKGYWGLNFSFSQCEHFVILFYKFLIDF